MRVALNTCLLLASHPNYRHRGERERRLIRLSKSGKHGNADVAKQKLGLLPQIIDFVTPPKLYNSFGTPTGIIKRPHWRKGHFRNQACGPAWTEHRIVFILATLIHRESADSETNQIEVIGSGPAPSEKNTAVPEQGECAPQRTSGAK